MSRLYVGIDPGSKGCIALVWERNNPSVEIHKIQPELETCQIWGDIYNLKRYAEQHEVYVVMEKVGGYIKGRARPGSHMFNFGRGVGLLEMALYSLGFSEAYENLILCPPSRWQKALDIQPRKKSESTAQWKNRLKDHATVRFPQVAVILQSADALLIAEFCRLKHQGKVEL